MRRWPIVLLLFAASASGCGRYEGPVESSPEHATVARPATASWTMSTDSYGPVTTDMTRKQILATGMYRAAPYPCGDYRLAWHSQKYEAVPDLILEDGVKKTGFTRVGPELPSITFDPDGRVAFIDPDPRTETDTGIEVGDSLTELEAAYPGQLRREPPMGFAGEARFGVTGKRSHLVFYVEDGEVRAFYLTPGALKDGDTFYAAMRGASC